MATVKTSLRASADRTFSWVAIGAAALVLARPRLIAVTMTQRARGPCSARWASTSSRRRGGRRRTSLFGALPFIWGTLFTAVIAVVIAVPISLGVALFITQVAPRVAEEADGLRASTCSRSCRRSCSACGACSCCRSTSASAARS